MKQGASGKLIGNAAQQEMLYILHRFTDITERIACIQKVISVFMRSEGTKSIRIIVIYLIFILSLMPKYDFFFGLILLFNRFLKIALDLARFMSFSKLFQSFIVEEKKEKPASVSSAGKSNCYKI